MAIGDIKIVEPEKLSTENWQVQDRTSSSDTVIYPGEPVKQAADGSPYVIHLATGDPEIGTDIFVGIAASQSTETATADGSVEVYKLQEGMVLRGKATTAGNVDTAAKINALRGDCVTFDLTSTTYTIDEDEGNDNNVHGLIIMGGDPDKGTLDVRVKMGVRLEGVAL